MRELAAGSLDADALQGCFKEQRAKLRRVINAAKRESGKKLIEEEDHNPPPKRKPQESIQDLFPRENEIPTDADGHTERLEEIMAIDDGTDITEEEVSNAIETMKKGKSPDGVTTEVVIWIWKNDPDKIRNMIQYFWRKQVFPVEWQVARVVLIPKHGVILNRLTHELERRQFISDRQHGFRPE
ncbi:hypothetical protein HHI36_022399 [Cryptolaemus montrouzieri]|uniref:Reverse transcriptase n=1 Tax=Cryptolaemus montrouzieri TaxID=559131 RepID=A0ABD2MZV7_9CUCU